MTSGQLKYQEDACQINDQAFVGREVELTALHDFANSAKFGNAKLVNIVARSGIGKSRLIEEFIKEIKNERFTITCGQAVDKNATHPFEMLRGLLQTIYDICSSNQELCDKVRSELSNDYKSILVSIFPKFSGIFQDEDQTIQNIAVIEAFGVTKCLRAFHVLLDLISSKDRPLLIILDDCQWADELTVKLIEHWYQNVESSLSSYTLIVCSFREEDTAENHPLLNKQLGSQLITLEALPKSEVSRLIDLLTDELPTDAKKFVIAASKGSPLLATSAVRGLIESGVLASNNSAELLPSLLADSNSNHFLLKRLEYIDEATREFLKWAAVAGKTFDISLYVSTENLESFKESTALQKAIARYFIEHRSDNTYSFVHDKIRETLLSIMTNGEFIKANKNIAETLIANNSDDVYAIAYHLDEAHETSRAFKYALAAAELSRACFSLDVAEKQYKIAEKGLDKNDISMRLKVKEGLGDVLMLRANYTESENYYQQVRQLTTETFDAARVERKLGELLFKMGRNLEATQALERALSYLGEKVPTTQIACYLSTLKALIIQALHILFPYYFIGSKKRAPNQLERLVTQIYNRLAIVHWFSNGIVKTLWSHLNAMNKIELYENSEELAHTYSSHGPAISLVGWYSRATQYGFKALKVLSVIPENKLIKGQCLHFNGVAHYCTAQFRSCIDLCMNAVKTLEDVGDYWEMNIASSNVALALYRLGSLNKAVSYSKSEYERTLAMGDIQSATVFLQVIALASEGDVPIKLFNELLEANKNSNAQSVLEAMCGKACILIRAKRYQEAADLLADARKFLFKSGAIQEYSFPILPWYATALRLYIEHADNLSTREQKKLVKTWKKVLTESNWGSSLRRNNKPHALRELAYFYAFKNQKAKAYKTIQKVLTLCEKKALLYEYSQCLVAYGEIKKAFGDTDFKEFILAGEYQRQICLNQEVVNFDFHPSQ